MKIFTLLFILISIPCLSQIEKDLLLHYKFDGNTIDETIHQFNGLPSGVTYVKDRFGNNNSAVHFNGINSFVDLPNIPKLKPQLPVSFSFWIKYDSNDYQDRAVFNTSFDDDISSGIYFNAQISNGNYAINYGDGTPSYTPNTRRSYVSNTAIENDEWHQIIVIVRTSLDMEIYVDCIESGGTYSGYGGDLFYTLGAGSIGRNDRNLNDPAEYFKGSLDDFKYWDRALTLDDIYSLCNALSTPEYTENKFIAYPNPAKNTLYVQADSKTDFHLNIFNNLGRLVLSTYSKDEIDISDLSNGLYFLQFSSEKNTQTKKLIINR